MPSLTPLLRPERTALLVALTALALQALHVAPQLEYRADALLHEPWRALTGHLVHLGWLHAALNGAALWIVARLFAPDLPAARQAIVLAVAAVVVSLALAWAWPAIAWYRGLSGLVHALYFAGAAHWLVRARGHGVRALWLPAVLLAGGVLKVLFEQPGGAATPYAEWLGAPVVPQAHLAGAACGTVLALLFAATDARREQ